MNKIRITISKKLLIKPISIKLQELTIFHIYIISISKIHECLFVFQNKYFCYFPKYKILLIHIYFFLNITLHLYKEIHIYKLIKIFLLHIIYKLIECWTQSD